MRKLPAWLLLLAIVLTGARLFTGVIYSVDSPVAYLVLKSAPEFRMERPEAEGAPLASQIVLDAEEPQLSYGWLYFGGMRAIPFVVFVMLMVCALIMKRGARLGPQTSV